jgi:glycerophosphoryl diester phosphodiesterase
MSKIIGHWGAAGVALENTLESIKLAQHMGVDGIEFDVRLTKDGKVVVCHDSNVSRISDVDVRIKDVTYAELQVIALRNDEVVPLLGDVLTAAKITPVVVDVKIKHHTEEILRVIDQFSDAAITMASFHREVVSKSSRFSCRRAQSYRSYPCCQRNESRWYRPELWSVKSHKLYGGQKGWFATHGLYCG